MLFTFPLPQSHTPSISSSKKDRPPRHNTQQDKARCHQTRQNPPIKAGRGNPIRGKECQVPAKDSEKHQLPLLGVPQNHQANNSCDVYAEDLGQTHAGPKLALSVSVGPFWKRGRRDSIGTRRDGGYRRTWPTKLTIKSNKV